MLVMEYVTQNGVKVRIHDDAYAGCSEEELQRRREEIQRTAWRCWRKLAEIRAGKGETNEAISMQTMPDGGIR